MTLTLPAVDVDAFHRDGYIVIPDVYREAELSAMRAEADRILELVVNASIALGRTHPRASMKVGDDASITMRKIQPINDLSDTLAAVSCDERLIAPMRQLMDDEPLLMEEKLNYKQRMAVPGADLSSLVDTDPDDSFVLHHDWGFYRQQGYPENTVSSAVALDDCAGRGPIKVIPRSHLLDPPLLNPDPAGGDGRVAPGMFDPADRVRVDATAGSVMLFHSKLLHDSEPNPSGLPRRLMIYSHYPASAGGDPDRRNGHLRASAAAFDQEYFDLVAAGDYADLFRLRSQGGPTSRAPTKR